MSLQPSSTSLPAPGISPSRDRRRAPRRACDLEAPFWPLGGEGGPPRWASVQNVSPGGVGLLLSCRFPPGAGLAIGLPPRCGGDGRPVFGRVVHATAAPQGNWWLGCALE
ncbi:MAG TPA: PilZ domain-containing protein [Gemmataceae bacterium]|nr:PilZ domain-containing protein [Gemmataceae bacterium]